MSPRSKPFVSEVAVTTEALTATEFDLRALAREKIVAMTEARGPRGGRYRLGPVERWYELEDDFHDHLTIIGGRRLGTYVRPQRAAG